MLLGGLRECQANDCTRDAVAVLTSCRPRCCGRYSCRWYEAARYLDTVNAIACQRRPTFERSAHRLEMHAALIEQVARGVELPSRKWNLADA